jgi:hypothetical protein
MSLPSYNAILAALDAGKGQTTFWGKNSLSTGAGTPWSLWFQTGSPGTGSISGTALDATQATKSTTGAMPFSNAGGGDALRLVGISAMAGTALAGRFILVDRLLYYPGITISSGGSPVALTAGASIPRYTTGAGVMAFLEAAGSVTHSTGTMSLSYTNQDGTASRTTEVVTYPTNPTQGRIAHGHGPFFPLQAGDTGIRSVQSITCSTTTSASSYTLVLCRPLASIPVFTANAGIEKDLVLQTPKFPEIIDDACLQWILWAGAGSTGQFEGELNFVAG